MERRALLTSILAGTVTMVLARFASSAGIFELPNEGDNRRFSVFYAGNRVGSHTISYSAATGRTRISTEIDLTVKAFFFTVFAYRHHSVETWRDGRLMTLRSETVEDDKRVQVEGAATSFGFRVVGNGVPFVAPSNALTSNSLWTPAVLEQDTVIDAQHGGVIGVSAHRIGVQHITLADRRIRATCFSFITPYLSGLIWYDESNRWVRGDFERNGSKILYQLDA